ncbi:MAG: TetR/AcrR family transcriptional regulator [Bacillota bacterium]
MEEQDKKEEILEAAAEVFSQKGFYKATVGEIAQQAGVAKGTIYLYFDSKEDLGKSLLRSKCYSLYQQAKEIQESNKPVNTKIKLIIEQEIKFLSTKKDLARAIILGYSGMSEELKSSLVEIREKKLNLLIELITAGKEEGIFRDVDAYDAALSLQGIMHNFGFHSHLNLFDDEVTVKELVERAFHLFICGVKSKN